VAVKVMTSERYREAQHRAAFRNEIQSVASLDHPGVVLVYDHGEVGPEAEEASLGLLPAGSPFWPWSWPTAARSMTSFSTGWSGARCPASSSPCSMPWPMRTPAAWSTAT